MSAQAELVFGPNPTPAELAFWRFHRANPHIYERIQELLEVALAADRRVGMRLIWERLRWDLTLGAIHAEGEPKLNDHFPPYYARLLMKDRPELEGYFEVRGNAARLALLPTSVPVAHPPEALGTARRLASTTTAPQLSNEGSNS